MESSDGSGRDGAPVGRRQALQLLGMGALVASCSPSTPAAPVPRRTPAVALPAQSLVARVEVGAWAGGGSSLVADHRSLASTLGVALPLFSWFEAFGSEWDPSLAKGIAGSRQPDTCMFAFEPYDVPLADIASGSKDDYLARFFTGVASYPGTVLVRLFHEMNGNWYPWSVATPGSPTAGTSLWVSAWRHTVAVARSHASNVRFVFCANREDVGGVPVEQYWPGADVVDVLGIDGYNFDFTATGSPVVAPAQLVSAMYARLCRLHPTAPVVLSEVGCAAGPAKAEWFRQLFLLQDLPRVTGLALFHEDKERNWRVDSDPATLAVCRDYLQAAAQQTRPAPRFA